MEFKILGPVEVLDPDGTRVDLGGPKQRALLGLLLCEAGRVVSLDRIIDELWGDEPPPAATGTLQAYISVLRRGLEPDRKPRQPAQILQTAPPGYRLQIEPEQLDAHRFEHLVRTADELLARDEVERAEEDLTRALALWRGEPLADVAHERFAQAEVTRLTELRYAAFEARAAAQLTLGRHGLAIPELERLIGEHPLREGLRAHLILALYQAGRQADALQAYRDTRRMLADELGIDPSPELQQLEADILCHSDRLRLRPRPREQLAVTLEVAPPVPAAGPGTAGERPFVGRDAEITAIEDALARARSGAGGLVLISGEAGIGKTSVAEAAARLAGEAGMLVAWGSCSEAQASFSYRPWMELGRMVREQEEVSGHDTSDLRTILNTDVVGMLTGIDDPVDADAARFRYYDGIARDIETRAARRPGLFVLDDLQWADRSSLHLLRFLVPRLARVPLLIIATYRSEEIATSDALDESVGGLLRERNVERIAVGGLSVDEIDRYLQVVGTRAEGGLAAALAERTDGNPFYMIETVRLLTSEGLIGSERSPLPHMMEKLPLAVQDVIRRRVARLPDDTRAILGVASVVGRDFPVQLVADAARIELDTTLDLLEPALVTRVLADDPQPGRLRFSHALVRETLFWALSPLQRARIHLRVGEALAARYEDAPDAPVAELAHFFSHAMSAGGAPRALQYAQAAARQATATFAYDEAVELWTAALAAAELASPADLEARLGIMLELGLALRRAGDITAGWQRIEQVIDLAQAAGDEQRAVTAAVSFGGVDLWNWRGYGEVNARVVSLLEDALSWVPERAPELHARVLATLAVKLAYGDRKADGEAYGLAAIEAARAEGDPAALVRALNAFFLATWGPGTEGKRLEAMNEYVSVAASLSPEVEAVGLLHRLMLLLRAGGQRTFEQDLERLRVLAREVRSPDLRAQIACVETMRATAEERWEDAERLSAEIFRTQQEASLWGFGWVRAVQALTLLRQRGSAAHGVDDYEALDPVLTRPLVALGLIEQGRLDEARALVEAGAAPPRRDWAWEFTTVVWAEVAAALGTPDPAALYAQLEDRAGVTVVAGTCIASWGSMHGVLGRLAAAMGKPDLAVEHLRSALAVDEVLGAPAITARTRRDLEGLLTKTGARA